MLGLARKKGVLLGFLGLFGRQEERGFGLLGLARRGAWGFGLARREAGFCWGLGFLMLSLFSLFSGLVFSHPYIGVGLQGKYLLNMPNAVLPLER